MRSMIKNLPFIGPIMQRCYRYFFNHVIPFHSSEDYWATRYERGGNSGAGSYGRLGEFKARILNNFVEENDIQLVIEYGCGDGAQLMLAKYPRYIGFDVSERAMASSKKKFSDDRTKSFHLVKQYDGERAQLTISLDVIYHLVEDDVFNEYMARLFNSSSLYVIIYSSNKDLGSSTNVLHVRHRKFSDWIESNATEWVLLQYIQNDYPYSGDQKEESFADFYIYKKT